MLSSNELPEVTKEDVGETEQVEQEEIQPEAQMLPVAKVPYRHMSGLISCMSRPQYKRTCGLSSLISIFNYQFSTLGIGKLPPITMEEALIKLNLIGEGSIGEKYQKKKPQDNINLSELGEDTAVIVTEQTAKSLHQMVNEIDFGKFTGNATLLRWYRVLCRLYGVVGRSSYFYKTSGKLKTQKTEKEAKEQYIEQLLGGKTCFIYHAYDHYFCPYGYEIVPKGDYNPYDQSPPENIDEGDLWILVGEPSKCFPVFHTFNWQEIQKDLTTYYPNWFNIRNKKSGCRQVKEGTKKGGTINCILAFEKLKD